MRTWDNLVEKIALPPRIEAALREGFDLALSISGGKDSDAMARLLAAMHRERGWPGRILLMHADLGRAEHRITPRYVERFADELGLPLAVIDGGDLVDVIHARRAKLAAEGRSDVPFWPSARARYCTSKTKRDPLSQFLRWWAGREGQVICAMGLRADESHARAKKAVVRERRSVHTQSRTAYDWLPLHHFSTTDVWATLGYTLAELAAIQERAQGMTPAQVLASDFRAHPAYALGNDRLSCGLCIFGSAGDLLNGARQNPEVYREYVQLELETGFSFQPHRWLADVAPELLTTEQQVQLATLRGTEAPQAAVQLPLF